jgi:hypothetical protein
MIIYQILVNQLISVRKFKKDKMVVYQNLTEYLNLVYQQKAEIKEKKEAKVVMMVLWLKEDLK